MTKQQAQTSDPERQEPKYPSAREQFGSILHAVAACRWDASLERAGIVQSNWMDPTWCSPARRPDYLKRWVVEAWIPAAAEISKLYSGGRIRVRGLKLKLALGAQPRDATLRSIVDVTQQHFRRLLVSADPSTLVDQVVRDLVSKLEVPTVHPQQVHLYFDYLSDQLQRQFEQHLKPTPAPWRPRIGRKSNDPERDQLLDDAVKANGGKMLPQEEVIKLLECTKEEAKDFMHRGRERQRSANLARKRLRPG